MTNFFFILFFLFIKCCSLINFTKVNENLLLKNSVTELIDDSDLNSIFLKQSNTDSSLIIPYFKEFDTNINKKDIIFKIFFKNNNYIVFIVTPSNKYKFEILNKLGSNIQSDVYDFDKIKDKKLKEKQTIFFALNGGMYHSNLSPVGLLINNGNIENPINLIKKGNGNFFTPQPNGVFGIDDKNIAIVTTTDSFDLKLTNKQKFKVATQSGPMLVINNAINPNFNINSTNFNIRNGVGVDRNNRIFFVFSENKINFYDLASLFKDKFKCKNALYLDGVISQYYIPHKKSNIKNIPLGPIIVVSKNKLL